MPSPARYSQIAWVAATIWSSLNVAVQRGPAVPGGAERHPLSGLAGIGMQGVVGRDQLGDVHEILSGGGLAGARTPHAAILACRPWRPIAPQGQVAPAMCGPVAGRRYHRSWATLS